VVKVEVVGEVGLEEKEENISIPNSYKVSASISKL